MSYQDGRYENRVECTTTPVWVPLTDGEWRELEEFSSGVPTFDDMVATAVGSTPGGPYIPPVGLPGVVGPRGNVPPTNEVPLPPAGGVFLLGALLAAIAFTFGRRRQRKLFIR